MPNAISKKKLFFGLILILNFSAFIPVAKSIKDTVYLDKRDVTPVYSLETNEGDLISWEFRTYNNSFICELRCLEWSAFVSWDKTSDKGILEVLESNTYRFRFKNIGDTGGGYLEFEIKIIKRIPGYNLISILIIVSCVSIISLLHLKKLKNV